MNNATTVISVQVDVKDKEEASSILKDLGLTMSSAINIFLKQIIKQDGIPFEIKNPQPSRELYDALQEAEDIRNGKIQTKAYRDVDKMFEDILNED